MRPSRPRDPTHSVKTAAATGDANSLFKRPRMAPVSAEPEARESRMGEHLEAVVSGRFRSGRRHVRARTYSAQDLETPLSGFPRRGVCVATTESGMTCPDGVGQPGRGPTARPPFDRRRWDGVSAYRCSRHPPEEAPNSLPNNVHLPAGARMDVARKSKRRGSSDRTLHKSTLSLHNHAMRLPRPGPAPPSKRNGARLSSGA
jgi:hypothetical protein